MAPVSARDLIAVVPCHLAPPGEELLRRLSRQVPRIVVVDDGLRPEDAAALDSSARRLGIEVLRDGGSHGKGGAVCIGLAAVRSAGPRFAAMLVDGDGQHPPEAIPMFVAAAGRAELVIGDRFGQLDRMPAARRIGNLLACAALAVITRKRLRDTQCGMRLLHGRALHALPPGPGGFEAETRHLRRCLRAGLSVVWVPIPAIYDGEPSDYRAVVDTARIAGAMIK